MKRVITYPILGTFLLGCFLLNCSKDPAGIEISTSYDWEISTPEAQQLDPVLLNAALAEAEKSGYINSFLIIKNGYLVAEKYFNGYGKGTAFSVQSVSKSFISALTGIALRENFLDSADRKILDFFPEYVSPGMDPRKHDITIRHLLTMTAGFDHSIEDYDVNWNRWITSSNWVGYALALPLEANPGEKWAYITAETHLLSVILTKATGMSTLEFAKKYLFGPLGIAIGDWEKDPQGYYIGGMRMYFTARNMARLGYLYLNNGFLDGRQIVPADWVRTTTAYYSGGTGTWGALTNWGYGYLWWMGYIGSHLTYFALGYGGQFVLVFPEWDMIVVTTSDWRCPPAVADQHERGVLDIVAQYVIPSAENTP